MAKLPAAKVWCLEKENQQSFLSLARIYPISKCYAIANFKWFEVVYRYLYLAKCGLNILLSPILMVTSGHRVGPPLYNHM